MSRSRRFALVNGHIVMAVKAARRGEGGGEGEGGGGGPAGSRGFKFFMLCSGLSVASSRRSSLTSVCSMFLYVDFEAENLAAHAWL